MGKRRRRHPASILPQTEGTCWLCVRLHGDYRHHSRLETHHIFPGTANRALSEEYGLKVRLCPAHHQFGPEAVHGGTEAGIRAKRLLQEEGQRAFEGAYQDLDFREIFGRNYL